jgi:hypothetical protein
MGKVFITRNTHSYFMRRKCEEYEQCMVYTGIYLSKADRERICKLVEGGGCVFDNMSDVIRWCIREKLPDLEKEMMR